MTSKSQLSLFPERGDQRWSPLHRLEPIAGELADFANGAEAQIGDLMLLEIGPDRLNRIEFRGIGRQARNRKMAVQFFQPGVEFSAAMDGSAIPDDQQRFLDLTLECTEKFDDLLGTNGPGKEPEVELREGQAGNGRELLPGEAVLKNRCLTTQAPSAGHTGPFAQSGFVDEDDGAVLSLGFFLSAGQPCRFHRTISGSLRWMARFSGFWQEKPIRRSRCHK